MDSSTTPHSLSEHFIHVLQLHSLSGPLIHGLLHHTTFIIRAPHPLTPGPHHIHYQGSQYVLLYRSTFVIRIFYLGCTMPHSLSGSLNMDSCTHIHYSLPGHSPPEGTPVIHHIHYQTPSTLTSTPHQIHYQGTHPRTPVTYHIHHKSKYVNKVCAIGC